MDRVLPPPLVTKVDWEPKLKGYPHFDQAIRKSKILELVTNPESVSKNTFYPFLLYNQSWQPFRIDAPEKPDKKIRPIRYASRRDSYIFAYYRHLLAAPYEELLLELGISDSVSAYRRIRQENGAGKSNIEFARDAFEGIAQIGTAAVVAVDISGFFESLDHGILRNQWCRVLGVPGLPKDHEAVFRAITRYAVVDRDSAYRRLGLLTEDSLGRRKFAKIPRKLCSNKEFRDKICGGVGPEKSLIDVNRRPYGIPQGSPISDMLANIYMIDFDIAMNSYATRLGGIYRRYSDDVLIVLPGSASDALGARDAVVAEVGKYGAKLRIKDSKTAVLHYAPRADGNGQTFTHVAGEQGVNGLEYLGFRYDGREIWLRDATLSRLYRKVAASVRSAVEGLIKRYPGKDAASLESSFDYSDFFQRYGRVDEFDPKAEFNTWTFWTYAKKAIVAFGPSGRPISRQLRRYKEIVRGRVRARIEKALG